MSSKNKTTAEKSFKGSLNRDTLKMSQNKLATSSERTKHKTPFPASKKYVSKNVSPSKRKLEEEDTRDVDFIVSTKDPPPLVLPLPNDDIDSFLGLLSGIIQKHLEEEDSVDLDEKRVEQSRRSTQATKEDVRPLLNQASYDEDLYFVDLDTYNEREILDCTYDFDPIVLEAIEETPEAVESNTSLSLVKNQVDDVKNKSPKDDKSPVKDYISWLIFDDDGEFIKFKDECDLIEREPVFDEATREFFSTIEQSIRQYENMSSVSVRNAVKSPPVKGIKSTTNNVKIGTGKKASNEREDDEKSLQKNGTIAVKRADESKFRKNPHGIINDANKTKAKDDRIKKSNQNPKNVGSVDLKPKFVIKSKPIEKAKGTTTQNHDNNAIRR